MWLQAAVNMEEKNRKYLVRPYMQHIEQQKNNKKTENAYKTVEQAVDFIFSGI